MKGSQVGLKILFLILSILIIKSYPAYSSDLQKGKAALYSGDYATALKVLKPLAQQGNIEAQFLLSVTLENIHDKDLTKNPKIREKIEYWISLSAQNGWAEASEFLGHAQDGTLWPDVFPRNTKAAIKWFSKAVDQGSTSSITDLARIYENPESGPLQDIPKALKYFRRAAEMGDWVAQWELGNKYELGKNVEHNPVKSLMWLKRSAEQGYQQAQQDLGRIFMDGKIVNRNYDAAIKWFNAFIRETNKKGDKYTDLKYAQTSLNWIQQRLMIEGLNQCLYNDLDKVKNSETKKIVELRCKIKLNKMNLIGLSKYVN